MMDFGEISSYHCAMHCYIKGEWVKESEARISIDERGFRFGDGVFETIRVRDSIARHLALHLQRLAEGLQAIRIAEPAENLTEISTEILRRNAVTEGVLRISVSRGIGSRGYLPTVSAPPTVVMETLPLPVIQTQPLTLWLSSLPKINAGLPVQYKLMQGLNSTLARMEAADHGCDEALMLNSSGNICEASSASIFWRDAQGIIHTPALECGVLAGISRQILLERWQDKVQQRHYPLDALRHAHSVMITNAITGPRAVTALHPGDMHWPDTSLAEEARLLF